MVVCRKHYSWNSEGGSDQVSLSLEEDTQSCAGFFQSVKGHFAKLFHPDPKVTPMRI